MSWVSNLARVVKDLRKPENAPVLPIFQRIMIKEIPAGSALIFQGFPLNYATERICVHELGCPFHPPAHAALMRRDGMFHNVGRWRTEEPLVDECRSERRIDVIIYKTMTELDRTLIMQAVAQDVSKPKTSLDLTDYGIRTFLHQGLRFIKPGKEPICSENVVKHLLAHGIRSSYDASWETAPFELVTFAIRNTDLCELRTVHVGKDFAVKASKRPVYPLPMLVPSDPSEGTETRTGVS